MASFLLVFSEASVRSSQQIWQEKMTLFKTLSPQRMLVF